MAINHTIHQLPVTLSSREIDGRRANQLRLSTKALLLSPRPFLTVSEEEKCKFFFPLSFFLNFIVLILPVTLHLGLFSPFALAWVFTITLKSENLPALFRAQKWTPVQTRGKIWEIKREILGSKLDSQQMCGLLFFVPVPAYWLKVLLRLLMSACLAVYTVAGAKEQIRLFGGNFIIWLMEHWYA